MNTDTSETTSHQWVKEIRASDRIHGLYLVKTKKMGLTRKGAPFLSLTLADRTGELEAKVWDRADVFSPLFKDLHTLINEFLFCQ